jgi:hypothetical protein
VEACDGRHHLRRLLLLVETRVSLLGGTCEQRRGYGRSTEEGEREGKKVSCVRK